MYLKDETEFLALVSSGRSFQSLGAQREWAASIWFLQPCVLKWQIIELRTLYLKNTSSIFKKKNIFYYILYLYFTFPWIKDLEECE